MTAEMDSETDPQEGPETASKQDAAMRREIVRNLAECLLQSDGLRELSNELDRKGMFNSLHDGMSEEEASQALYDLVENFNLLWSDVSLKQVMKSDPNERGAWALSTLYTNISNEDSS